jgi:hypothetical protein
MYQIEDIEYDGNNPESALIKLRLDSEDLAREIEKEESEDTEFKLRDYRDQDKSGINLW